MNELQIFENSEFGSVRTVEVNGKTYFVANDVAKALGYVETAKAIRTHCKGVSEMDIPTNGGIQKMKIITEGDIYRLVIKSQLPDADKFESWIFDEVLPSIRKHGNYSVQEKPVNAELSPELQMLQGLLNQMVQKELEDKERDRQIALANETAKKSIETTENIKEAVKPIFDNWREEINSKFNRIQRNADKPFNLLRSEMYSELERRGGCDLGTRLRNKQARMREYGRTKTEINNLNKMDIIEEDKRLKEIFSKIVSEYEIRYCA